MKFFKRMSSHQSSEPVLESQTTTENPNLNNLKEDFIKVIDKHGLMVSVFSETDINSNDELINKMIQHIKNVDDVRNKWITQNTNTLRYIYRNPGYIAFSVWKLIPKTIRDYKLFTADIAKFCYDLEYMAPEGWSYFAWNRLMRLLTIYLDSYNNESWYQKTVNIVNDTI